MSSHITGLPYYLREIIMDSDKNLYVTNYNNNNVVKITPSGISSILGTTGSSPWGITVDGS